jgi:hypothetical protein
MTRLSLPLRARASSNPTTLVPFSRAASNHATAASTDRPTRGLGALGLIRNRVTPTDSMPPSETNANRRAGRHHRRQPTWPPASRRHTMTRSTASSLNVMRRCYVASGG